MKAKLIKQRLYRLPGTKKSRFFFVFFASRSRIVGILGLFLLLSGVPSKKAWSTNPNDIDFDVDGKLGHNLGGIRPWLAQYGVAFHVFDVNEVWGNVSGGSHQGAAYDGVTQAALTIDLNTFAGFPDALFNVSGLQIRGRSISQDQLGVLNPVSGFEADRSLRLWELWYQQNFSSLGFDIKFGQIGIDTEFLISTYANYFYNASFGWPLGPSVNIYAGGPSWPLAALGARARYSPDDEWTIMFAAADDNPPGGPFYNPNNPTNQSLHTSGANFNLGTGALLITELQYQLNPQPDDMNHALTDPGLPATFKVGGFYDTGYYPDQRYDNQGHSLASPESKDQPFRHKSNWEMYGIIDAMLWRPDYHKTEFLAGFVRFTGNGGDRNQVTLALDSGLVWKGMLPDRPEDEFGIGVGFGKISHRARAYDRDVRYYTKDPTYPLRNYETHFEVTYNIQIASWMNISPDFQYIWNPGGKTNYQPGKRYGNEAIFGLHTLVSY